MNETRTAPPSIVYTFIGASISNSIFIFLPEYYDSVPCLATVVAQRIADSTKAVRRPGRVAEIAKLGIERRTYEHVPTPTLFVC